jgi:hypothetical protein
MKCPHFSVFTLAIMAGLVGSAHAQSAAGGAAAQTNVRNGTATAAQANTAAGLAGRPDAWRYAYHNNQWWYYHPNNTWSVWNGAGWIPYRPYATGYRGFEYPAAGGIGVVVPGGDSLSDVDALPGRANPQMAGGGIGIYGSPILDGRNGGLPNISGGTLFRGSTAGRGFSDTDAVPGRSNPQMSGGGIGVYGSPLGRSHAGAPGLRTSGSTAIDALPGQRNPQMSGGGFGVNGSQVDGSGS